MLIMSVCVCVCMCAGFCRRWLVMIGCNQYLVLANHNSNLHDHYYALMHCLEYLAKYLDTNTYFVLNPHSGTHTLATM